MNKTELNRKHPEFEGFIRDVQTFVRVKTEAGLEMLDHPADLYRPTEDLVRPLFDSFIIVKK